MGRRRRHRRGDRLAAGIGAVLAVGLVAAAVVYTVGRRGASAASCALTSPSAPYPLDLAQAADASTIAAVGKRLGLPDHAVTIALAASLQESRLRNLTYGDRDSVGLFQQRPSQGWGTPAELTTPSYAATAFYQHLQQVPGWQGLAVADAAQAVQRSAAGSAYAQWEGEARAWAIALTGEVPAGLSCHFSSSTSGGGTMTTALAAEAGSPGTDVAVSPSRGWLLAAWLVGHAAEYGVRSVTFAGQTWTPGSGAWQSAGPPTSVVQVVQRSG
jgi:hypothetical protein